MKDEQEDPRDDGSVADYRFQTTWRLPASQQDAWTLLYDGEGWPRWWPSVRKVELLEPGSPDGLGRLLRFHFSTRLPYTLTFEARLVEVAKPTRLVAAANGELAGTWTCDLFQDGANLVVRHVWAVSTTQRWMNLLAPVASPFFSWNHAALMREGGQGFAAQLGTTAQIEGAPERHRALSALTVTSVAVALVPIVRAARRRRWRRLEAR